jgi:hypothetical protein
MSEENTQYFPQEDLKRILARLDSIDNRLTALDNRLSTLEEKVDRRLMETQPIWEQVLARLDSFENGMRDGFRKLDRQIGLLAEDVLTVRADQRALERRMDKLESEPAQ